LIKVIVDYGYSLVDRLIVTVIFQLRVRWVKHAIFLNHPSQSLGHCSGSGQVAQIELAERKGFGA
jgi:hypothetical protein